MQHQVSGLELRRACPIFLIGFGQEQTMALDTSPSFHSWRSPKKLPKSIMMRWKILKKNWHKRCKHETKCLWVAPMKKKNKAWNPLEMIKEGSFVCLNPDAD